MLMSFIWLTRLSAEPKACPLLILSVFDWADYFLGRPPSPEMLFSVLFFLAYRFSGDPCIFQISFIFDFLS